MLPLSAVLQAAAKEIMRSAPALVLAAALVCPALPSGANTNVYSLGHSASPTNNPLKGFMPFSGNYANFPHSMEWSYLPLRPMMTGPTNFNWSSLDTLLNTVSNRGHHAVFRVYLDYPGSPTGIPQYLLDAGLPILGTNGASLSPDYENPMLRQALTNFIAALGARYDGDPRIGFITVGLLGFWGEWHTYPNTSWFASTTVQNEVLTAYTNAFHQTRLLLRYPTVTGTLNPATLPFGYHDDSFAYSTIAPPSWHFLGQMAAEGESNKWKTQPIGGEVRPEVQPCMWDTNQPTCVPAGQEFSNCVALSHASWMINHKAFSPGFSGDQKTRAVAGSTSMGYELYVTNATLVDASVSGPLRVDLQLQNTGVAPFYYDWPVQLGARSNNVLVKTWTTTWKLSSLLPAATNTLWTWSQTGHGLPAGPYKLLLRVQNPLTNGVPFRFANVTQDADVPGWLTLGQVTIVPTPARPTLRGSLAGSVFILTVSNAAPGLWWTVEKSANLTGWTTLLSTNTSTPDWNITDAASAATRFYRVVNLQ